MSVGLGIPYDEQVTDTDWPSKTLCEELRLMLGLAEKKSMKNEDKELEMRASSNRKGERSENKEDLEHSKLWTNKF